MLLDHYKIKKYMDDLRHSPSKSGDDVFSTIGVKGEIEDRIHHTDGKGNIVRTEVLQGHNIIVADFSKVIAGMLRGFQHSVSGESVVISALDAWIALKRKRAIPGTFVVTNNAGDITYVLGTDYEIDFVNSMVRAKTGGDIAGGSTIRVSYKHYQNLYWAVGSGDVAWDNQTDPSVNENGTSTKLVSEIYRKYIPYSAFTFINLNNEEVTTPTNRVQITITFTEDEANGDLREFAIVGFDASPTANTGIPINHKIHKRISKVDTMQLERVMRFTF